MKIVLKILLLAAIGTLFYMCVQSIMSSVTFIDENERRTKIIAERLVAIRNAQIGYRNMYQTYAGSFADLQKFLNSDSIPFLIKEGELTDEQLKAGMTEKQAIEKGIIRRDTTWVLAKDTLLDRGFDVGKIGLVPEFEHYSFHLDTATLVSPSGYQIPVFEASVPYDIYLGDLDKEELVNLKDKTTKLKRFNGLRVGSVSEINNNAGNWEF